MQTVSLRTAWSKLCWAGVSAPLSHFQGVEAVDNVEHPHPPIVLQFKLLSRRWRLTGGKWNRRIGGRRNRRFPNTFRHRRVLELADKRQSIPRWQLSLNKY